MQSIHSIHCENIAIGRKGYEVRKTKPNISTPFKVYIYETKDKKFMNHGICMSDKNINFVHAPGKVIGEYICDEITEYTTEFHPADDLFQGIWKTVFDEDAGDTYGEIVTSNDFDNPDDCDICKKSCLTFNDIKKYVGYGDKKFYAYHISDLKIYDEPKELSDYYTICNKDDLDQCGDCKYIESYYSSFPCEDGGDWWCTVDNKKPLTRPPQSWCYVEEVSQ